MTWEELLGGDALGEGGVREGLPRQAQLLTLHAAHPLEVAASRLPVLHTQLTATTCHLAAAAHAARTQGSNVTLHICRQALHL